MSEDRQERFAAYVEALAEVIGHADRAEPLRNYCLGLLLPGDRKSVEPIAAVTAPARVSAKHQSLLHFVGVRRCWGRRNALLAMRALVKIAACAVGRGQANLPKVLSFETSGWAAIAGGPSIHADALAHEICDHIAAGESLRAICRDDHMPGPGDY